MLFTDLLCVFVKCNVAIGVLNKLEFFRSKLFLGAEMEENKMYWVSWEKVMTFKKKGGLGVSSFFALNGSLVFKWIRGFRANQDALWVRVVKSILDVHGFLSRVPPGYKTSTCIHIIDAITYLRENGVDLMSFVKRKSITMFLLFE